MELNSINIGNRIKNLIQEKRMKQKEFEEKYEIAHSTLSSYTTGKRIPNTEEIYKLSICLETTVEYILTGIISNNATLSREEIEIITNYRKCDQRGKDLVKNSAFMNASYSHPEEIDTNLLISNLG